MSEESFLGGLLARLRQDVRDHQQGTGRWANPLTGKPGEKPLDKYLGDPRTIPLQMALGLLGPKSIAPSMRHRGMPETVNLPGEGKVPSAPLPDDDRCSRPWSRR